MRLALKQPIWRECIKCDRGVPGLDGLCLRHRGVAAKEAIDALKAIVAKCDSDGFNRPEWLELEISDASWALELIRGL